MISFCDIHLTKEPALKKDSPNFKYYLNALKRSPNFSGFSDDIMNEILNVFYVETWSKGDLSFEGDKTLHTFYFVVSGRIKTYKVNPETGNEFILYINAPGDIFDVICLLDGKRHDVEMEALDDVTLLAAPIDVVREWIMKHAEFNKILLPYLADKFRVMEEKANDLALFDTWTRTVKLFIKHTKVNMHGSELKLINNLSHSEIAKIIGTSKNVINRHIQRLKNEKILHVDRKHIEIENLQGLLNKLKNHS
ncbi:MAG: Crp/Fnr family transcriptional regulator [Flavobacteriia bacterium]|nr:MAG: Crp/Fnr family transcriptional regulator [Flavobacteriia bacterium]